MPILLYIFLFYFKLECLVLTSAKLLLFCNSCNSDVIDRYDGDDDGCKLQLMMILIMVMMMKVMK